MHYDGMTFRPPYEAYSLLLQVTRGCSHNACTFCSMYRSTPFSVSPVEEIVDDLAEASRYWPGTQRVFLVNGDAFCLPAEALLNIAEMVRTALPAVESIGCYARITNGLMRKLSATHWPKLTVSQLAARPDGPGDDGAAAYPQV